MAARGPEVLVPFDSKSCRHKRELLQWCTVHWGKTFHPSLQAGNPLYYYSCCGGFARRWFAKNAGHPPLESCSILKIPSFRGVSSADELYKWLLLMYAQNATSGKTSYFPTINSLHVKDNDIDHQLDQEETVQLSKRLDELHSKLRSHEDKLKELESMGKASQQLLSSSRNWHAKYQELLDKQQNTCPEEFITPVKKRVNCFDVYEYNY